LECDAVWVAIRTAACVITKHKLSSEASSPSGGLKIHCLAYLRLDNPELTTAEGLTTQLIRLRRVLAPTKENPGNLPLPDEPANTRLFLTSLNSTCVLLEFHLRAGIHGLGPTRLVLLGFLYLAI
jgi:hypothetical protein